MSSTLADLRRENLKQMNRAAAAPDASNESPEPPGAPEAENEAAAAILPENPASVSTASRKSVSTVSRKDGSTAVRKSAGTAVRTGVGTDAGIEGTATADSLLDAVRESLAKKTIHPVGVKTTVEMPAELSQRAKRYSLDHGNVPVRQVFLELMIAFLEKEGY